jgi:hypothetical protein
MEGSASAAHTVFAAGQHLLVRGWLRMMAVPMRHGNTPCETHASHAVIMQQHTQLLAGEPIGKRPRLHGLLGRRLQQ